MNGLCKECRYYHPQNPKMNCDIAFTIQNIEDRDDVKLSVNECIDYEKK